MQVYVKKIFLFFILTYFSLLGLFNSIFNTKIKFSIIIIIVGVIFIYFFKLILNNQRYKKKFYVIFILYIFYCIFLIGNGIYFKNNARLLIGVYEYIFYSLPVFIPVFVFYREFTFKYIEKIIAYLILINLIMSVLALYEYTTGNYIVKSEVVGYADMTYNLVRAKVFDDSYLGLGALIAQLAILNLYFIFNKGYTFKHRLLFFCSFIINIMGIVATNSRGPLVACIVSIMLYIILYYIFINSRQNNTKKSIGIICIFILLAIIFYCFTYLSNYQSGQISNHYLNYVFYRISSIFNWNDDKSNLARKHFWYYFIGLFKENYLYGIGVSSTGGRILTTSIGPTESAILKRYVELGIFGASIFYLMIIYSFLSIIKFLRYTVKCLNGSSITIMVMTLFSAVFVTFFDGITYQVCESQQTMFFNWFIFGILILIISKQKLKN